MAHALKTAMRFDRGSYKPVMLANGWLRADAQFVQPGVYAYRQPDGIVRHELKPPEEIFNPESIASLAMVPLTKQHPQCMLDAVNTRQYAVGSVGENIRRDGDWLAGGMLVTDADTINDVKGARLTDLSCGCQCVEDPTPGEWHGQKYDLVQRQIRYNHVAIAVPQGRVDGASIRMDSEGAFVAPAQQVPTAAAPPNVARIDAQEYTVKIQINGITFDVADQVAEAINIEKTRADATQKETSGKVDALQAKCDSADKQVADLKNELSAAPAKQRAAIQARASLEAAAGTILGADVKMDDMSDDQVRVAVLAKLAPTAKMDGKSPEYISARYDAEVERVKTAPAAPVVNRQLAALRIAAAPAAPVAPAAPRTDAAPAREPGWRNQAYKQPLSITRQ